MDYADWTRSVATFLRGLTYLPGRIAISDGIEPPARDDMDLYGWWLAAEKCTLPTEIGHFVYNASARCHLFYQWFPPTEYWDRFSA